MTKLFFDGTGNNLQYDLTTKSQSNVTALFEANDQWAELMESDVLAQYQAGNTEAAVLTMVNVADPVVREQIDSVNPEFPEFITREGQRLTPRIIPSASS